MVIHGISVTEMLSNNFESSSKKKRKQKKKRDERCALKMGGIDWAFHIEVGWSTWRICLCRSLYPFAAGEIFEAVWLWTANMSVNAAGIAAVAVFYLVILVVGMLAAWKQRKAGRGTNNPEENIMLAKRDLGLFVGVLTMTGKESFEWW